MSSPRIALAALAAAVLLALVARPPATEGQATETGGLPDLSGLAWMGGDAFIAVHDAKNPDELDRPRVSLLGIPTTVDGVPWTPLDVNWPTQGGASSDLESAASVPDTSSVLLVESGEGGSARIFHGRLAGASTFELIETAQWPTPVENVEGSAVAKVDDRLVFVYAERAEGEPSTRIRWATFVPGPPMEFGRFRGVRYTSPGPLGPDARPVSTLEVRRGRIFTAGAFDPGDDNGPFRSTVWEIGRFIAGRGEGRLDVKLRDDPRRIGRLDGLKVESVATRAGRRGPIEIFAGTDDENYGGALRLLGRR